MAQRQTKYHLSIEKENDEGIYPKPKLIFGDLLAALRYANRSHMNLFSIYEDIPFVWGANNHIRGKRRADGKIVWVRFTLFQSI